MISYDHNDHNDYNHSLTSQGFQSGGKWRTLGFHNFFVTSFISQKTCDMRTVFHSLMMIEFSSKRCKKCIENPGGLLSKV